MTAIVVARHAGRVFVGSDRGWTDGVQTSRCGRKTTFCGRFLVGLAGSYNGDWEALSEADARTAKDVARSLGNSDAEVVLVDRVTRRVRYGARRGRAWVWADVAAPTAIGDAGLSALVAWDALRGLEADPVKRMRTALKATARHHVSVSGPFDVVTV